MSTDTEIIRKPAAPPRIVDTVLTTVHTLPLADPTVSAQDVATPASGTMSSGDRQTLRDLLAEWNEQDLVGNQEQQDQSWALLSRLLDEDHP